jgi:hypothetical protein
MKEWCLEHPYMTFFMFLMTISTIGNIFIKLLDIFVKSSPTTVNMNIDPTKIPGYTTSFGHPDDSIH